MQTVSTEVRGRTAIVTIERPQARNAVDGPTAQQLYDAFKAFDAARRWTWPFCRGAAGPSARAPTSRAWPRGAAIRCIAAATWGPWAARGFRSASR